jgi:hypothetical protein
MRRHRFSARSHRHDDALRRAPSDRGGCARPGSQTTRAGTGACRSTERCRAAPGPRGCSSTCATAPSRRPTRTTRAARSLRPVSQRDSAIRARSLLFAVPVDPAGGDFAAACVRKQPRATAISCLHGGRSASRAAVSRAGAALESGVPRRAAIAAPPVPSGHVLGRARCIHSRPRGVMCT